MNKLTNLIEQLCPNGVEFKPLGEIATISRGGSFQKKDFVDSGVPCIHYGQIYTRYGLFAHETLSFISNDVAKKQRYAQPNDIVMAVTSENIEDVCKCVAWLGDTSVAVSGHSAIIHHTQNAKYLAYYFHSSMFFSQKRKLAQGTKVIEVSPEKLNRVSIPVPPLEVQAEIVRILDTFTEHTTELTTELTARKKQYEFYRDLLLSSAKDNVEYSIQELIDLDMIEEPIDGNHGDIHPKKTDYVDSGVPFVMANNLINGTVDYDHCAYITEQQANSLRKGFAKPGDVLLTHKGTIGRTAIVPETYATTILTPQVTYYRVKTGIDNQYLKYCFDSRPFQEQMFAMAGLGGTRAYIGIRAQHALRLRIPSLDEQIRISTILDVFDNLCSNLYFGLPAEIEARKKQYEYYRDKLLSF